MFLMLKMGENYLVILTSWGVQLNNRYNTWNLNLNSGYFKYIL